MVNYVCFLTHYTLPLPFYSCTAISPAFVCVFECSALYRPALYKLLLAIVLCQVTASPCAFTTMEMRNTTQC